jgi:hypothetical protein
MRQLYTIATLFFVLLAISSCGDKPQTIYAISVSKDAICTSNAQEVTLSYVVHDNVMNSDTKFTATSSEAWAEVVDTSTIGEVRVRVEDNEGSTRTATITISAPGCVTAKARITQYGAASATANHTLMFYFFGTSLDRYFKINLADAARAIETGILGNNNRVLFFRQESRNSGYIGELCYDITNGKCIEVRIKDITLTESIITPEKIGEHIAAMAEIAPAERYGIILAGHGQGWITREIIDSDRDVSALSAGYNPWIPAIGAEVTRAFGENNVQVNIDELAEGIKCSNVEIDYILFDACFMSNIEAIYDLRHTANYIIASPCEIMAMGFPYHRVLKHLFADDGKRSDVVAAAEAYYVFYRDEYTSKNRSGSVAVIDCNELEALAEASRKVALTAITEYSKRNIQSYEGQSPHSFYDFGGWYRIVATDTAALEALEAQMERTVVARYTLPSFYSALGTYGIYPIDEEQYTGVTTSAPCKQYAEEWQQTSWGKRIME